MSTGFEVFREPAVIAVGIMIFTGALGYIFLQCERAVMKQHRRGD